MRFQNRIRIILKHIRIIRDYSGGLTLIETLLYTAIVAIVITAFMLSTYGLLQTSERVEAGIELADAKLFAEQKLEWLIQGVDAITVPAAGDSAATLTLNKVNFTGNPLTVDAASGALRLSSSGGTPVPLTPNGISISNVLFERTTAGLHDRLRFTALLTGRYATTSIDQTIIIK
ncbi:MAG: hypothetical protein HYV25_03105 [Candidatus Harrisonbacteria bacterium]|nr:hypothetical protein [Candidatus Harrisonbacteria bacterium]